MTRNCEHSFIAKPILTEDIPTVHSAKREAVAQKMAPSYRVIRSVVRFMLSLMARLLVTGEENLPCSGPCILVINHLHMFDPVVLMSALPFQVDVLVAEKYMKIFPIGLIVKLAGDS